MTTKKIIGLFIFSILLVAFQYSTGYSIKESRIVGLQAKSGVLSSLAGKLMGNKFKPPKPPRLIRPIKDMVITKPPVALAWSNCPKAQSYEVQYSQTQHFSNPQTLWVEDTITTMQQLAAGTVYWRVRALDKKGKSSSWSSVCSFTYQPDVQRIEIRSGCNGNCAACPHPCGRRRAPDYNFKDNNQ